MTFSAQVLAVDPGAVCAGIEAAIRDQVLGSLRLGRAVAETLGVASLVEDIEAKRRVARYLGAPPLLVEPL